jgi:predicted transcriptional regulator
MEPSDKIVNLKDWINSFWNFQEEDLQYLQNLIIRKSPLDPEEIINNLKERIKTRKAFYQIYKYLPRKDLSAKDLEWAEQKLAEIIYREDLITELTNKILDLLTFFVESEKIPLPDIPSNPFLVH